MSLFSKKATVRTPDGHTISLLVELVRDKQHSNSVVIMTHGIFTDQDEKGRFLRLSKRFRTAGIDVVRFDFRGHGQSPMPSVDFSVAGGVIDFHTVLNWVVNSGWKRVGVVGSSFGGGLVLLERQLPVMLPVQAIVLLNPVIDYELTFLKPLLSWGKDIFSDRAIQQILDKGKAKIVNDFEVSLLFLTELSLVRPYLAIAATKTPILVFHGDADEKVPLQAAKRYCVGQNHVTLKVVNGAGHAFKEPDIEDQVHEEAVAWLKETMSRTTN